MKSVFSFTNDEVAEIIRDHLHAKHNISPRGAYNSKTGNYMRIPVVFTVVVEGEKYDGIEILAEVEAGA